MTAVRARRQTLVVIALAFASVDLTHKLVVHADYHHVRSRYVAVAMIAVIAGLVNLVPRVPSRTAKLYECRCAKQNVGTASAS